MKDIYVSVIVPIYNVELWLTECLDSLERQTLGNIEVLLINDGATDGSEIIAKKYESRNANFKLINRPNGGLSAARNTGLEHARGKYVYFLDSDDYLADDALECLFKKAETEKLDVIEFSAYSFTDGSQEMKWECDFGYKYRCEYTGVYSQCH